MLFQDMITCIVIDMAQYNAFTLDAICIPSIKSETQSGEGASMPEVQWDRRWLYNLHLHYNL